MLGWGRAERVSGLALGIRKPCILPGSRETSRRCICPIMENLIIKEGGRKGTEAGLMYPRPKVECLPAQCFKAPYLGF